jgi:ABC-type amino acid transport substrate-binding protein
VRMSRAKIFVVLVSVALTHECSQAQPAISLNPTISDRELVIATKEAPPFAIKQQDGSWRGISIDLWRGSPTGCTCVTDFRSRRRCRI